MSGKDYLINSRDSRFFGDEVTVVLLDVSVGLTGLDFVPGDSSEIPTFSEIPLFQFMETDLLELLTLPL